MTEATKGQIGKTAEGFAMIVRRDESQLKEIAKGVVTGKIYVTNTITGVAASFGSLMLEMQPQIEAAGFTVDDYYGDVGAYYEYLELSTDVIEGIPIFATVQFIHVDDITLFLDYMRRMYAALDAV